VKSPVDLYVGTIRTTGILPDWWNSLPNRMAAIGQNLFEAPNVAGWPGGADWITPSRLLMRSDMISDIAGAEPASADDDTAAMMAQMLVPNPAEEAMFQSVYLRYAAEDFRGPPQFQVTAIETNSLAEVTNTWAPRFFAVFRCSGAICLPDACRKRLAEMFGRVVSDRFARSWRVSASLA